MIVFLLISFWSLCLFFHSLVFRSRTRIFASKHQVFVNKYHNHYDIWNMFVYLLIFFQLHWILKSCFWSIQFKFLWFHSRNHQKKVIFNKFFDIIIPAHFLHNLIHFESVVLWLKNGTSIISIKVNSVTLVL